LNLGYRSTPAFVDIDADGDADMFVGDFDGYISFFENTDFDADSVLGDPAFTPQTGADNPFNGVDVGSLSAPALVDIDGDGDFDAFIGDNNGTISFFENTDIDGADQDIDGPTFVERTGAKPLDGVNVGDDSTPTFVDIDNDGDADAVIGEEYGPLFFFENLTPQASVTVLQDAAEQGTVEGTFEITLAEALPGDLALDYTIGGSAIDPDDYTLLPGDNIISGTTTLTVTAGNITGTLRVIPVDDIIPEPGGETVVLTLQPDPSYTLGTASAELTISDNDPVARDDSYTTDEDVTLTVSAPGVLDNDDDGAGGGITPTLTLPPQHGTAVLGLDGSLVYTPTNNFSGTDTLDYLITDSNDLTDTATVTITVEPVNDAPGFTSTAPLTVTLNDPYRYDISATDIEDSDALTITAPTRPDWLRLTDGGDGTAVLSGTPQLADLGDHSVALVVRDSGGLTATQRFTVTVEALPPERQATLGVSISREPPQVQAGDTIIYTVDVNNSGPADATNVTTVITLSAGLTIEGTPTGEGWTCTVTGQEIRCTRDALATNASSSITIRATVTAAADETISASASVTADNSPAGEPAGSSDTTTVQSPGGGGTTLYLPLIER
jgi:uncharacterized repeat protein (TIGR01451 family)